MATILAWLLCALAIGSIGTTAYCALLVRTWSRRRPVSGPAEPVSLLKPLYGAEPRLAENLATFFAQDWGAPIEMIAGVQREADPARLVIAELRHSGEGRNPLSLGSISIPDVAAMDPGLRRDDDVVEVVDPTRHGANAKVGNLINIAPHVSRGLLIISDSDMAVPRDYLASLSGALGCPGVGAVTCLYRGRGDAGRWSQLAAAASSYHFLPSVLLGLSLKMARPCMGSTIALRRETLAKIGGFEAFADRIADDYDIGKAVRALGLAVAIPPLLLVHAATEDSLAALWRHELRWATTLRVIDPAGNAGMAFTYPLPFALALIPLMPRFGLLLFIFALLARFLLKQAVDRWAGASTCPFWMIPLRDCLSLALFCRAFVARSVDWRGATLTISGKGRIAAQAQWAIRPKRSD